MSINLSLIAPPAIVEPIDYESILAGMLADLKSRDPVFTGLVESDPAFKILEVAAYREVLLRQRVNDAAQSVMLAYSTGTDLDNLGTLFDVARLEITPADLNAMPPIERVMESDKRFRKRIQLSLNGLNTAGSTKSYLFHGLSASSEVKDISVSSPAPGEVLITVLSTLNDGAPSAGLVNTVNGRLSSDKIRPLTDRVLVQPATIQTYSIAATLVFFTGPDSTTIMSIAQQAAQDYVDQHHRLGFDITLSGIYAALHQSGVQNVTLTQPAADIIITTEQAAFCTSITLVNGGTGE